MAWVPAAVRWPDALTSEDAAKGLQRSLARVRPVLPVAFLRDAPDGLLVALAAVLAAVTLTLLTSFLRPTPQGRVSAKGAARQRSGARTVLLVGPSDSGKTSIFSALVFGSVPRTHTSQRESEGQTMLGPPAPLPGEEAVARRNTPVHLVDLPGHPRLRTRVNDFLPAADALIFCVDASLAAKASAGPALSEAVDLFHSTMTALATTRLRGQGSGPPPALQVLFTRSDLSPLLSSDVDLPKRKAQLLQRATGGFEAELARRRQALQVGRTTKLGAIGKVQGGSAGQTGFLGRLRRLLGAPAASSAQEEEDEDEGDDYDYLAWGATSGLDKLDAEVVEAGRAQFGLISLGRERDWFGGDGSRREGRDDRDLRAFLTSL